MVAIDYIAECHCKGVAVHPSLRGRPTPPNHLAPRTAGS